VSVAFAESSQSQPAAAKPVLETPPAAGPAATAPYLVGGSDPQSLDELLMLWHDSRERLAIDEAINRGFKDIEAGRFQSADEFHRDLRQEFGFEK
jgi:hypothetical protein